MGKIGGIIVVAALALAGCSPASETTQSDVQPASQVQHAAVSIQGDMLTELRPLLKSVKFDDATLVSKAYAACANLIFRDKDSYREAVLRDHPDLTVALDELTIAAAGKKYLCP
ncbi:hypothetical protein [Paenarthrobacter ureafaciens]|uniref:hypothetical protein n=1 Tax=Paenarthrobacter ureafaciens TaxID=37931 RepID=UPI001FB299B6|nr:hypothetical protein [Paenarthrobacter ureafaciens]UOD80360.1 hypothetical protein MQZ73_14725 [Paenarthrobacter ureafaciens]WNZ03013.1 hypothetical protein PVT25_15365 [Paenarthrobacter ureafaciens]